VATAFPHPNGIWLDLTVEEFMETSIQKWHNFVQAALQKVGLAHPPDRIAGDAQAVP